MTEQAPETLKDHWQQMTLRNCEELRYAVTITMKQRYFCKESELGHWEYLNPEKASRELRQFRNKLNDAIYGNNWHRRLRGRKPDGLNFIPVLQGQQYSGLDWFWSKNEEAKTPSYYSDEYGEIHFPQAKPSTRRQFQAIHYHCFIDRDLSRSWDNETKQMVETRSLSEMTTTIQGIWNQTAFGTRISKIDVQDIWSHPGQHRGWSDYITRDMFGDCNDYDHLNLVIP